MPKGGENKGQSDKWISYHLSNFENARLELLVCQNSLIVSYVKSCLLVGRNVDYERLELLVCQNSLIVSYVKSWLLVGRNVDYEKKGSF
jgi:hypothetical protein